MASTPVFGQAGGERDFGLGPLAGPPVSAQAQTVAGAGARLLGPDERTSLVAAWDSFFVWQDGKLSGHAAAGDSARWSVADVGSGEPRLLAVTAERVVLADGFHVTAIDAMSGERCWRWGELPAGWDAVGADHENFSHWRYFTAGNGLVVALREDGAVVALDLAKGSGGPGWTTNLPGRPSGDPLLAGGRVICPIRDQGRSSCVVLSREDGRRCGELPGPEEAQTERVLGGPNGTVAMVSAADWRAWRVDEVRDLWQRHTAGRVRAAALAGGSEGICYSGDGLRVAQLSWRDGAERWCSEPVVKVAAAQMSVRCWSDRVAVVGPDSVVVLNAGDGHPVAELVLPAGRVVAGWQVAARSVIVVSAPRTGEDGEARVHFVDCGGAGAGQVEERSLGECGRIGRVVVVDGVEAAGGGDQKISDLKDQMEERRAAGGGDQKISDLKDQMEEQRAGAGRVEERSLRECGRIGRVVVVDGALVVQTDRGILRWRLGPAAASQAAAAETRAAGFTESRAGTAGRSE